MAGETAVASALCMDRHCQQKPESPEESGCGRGLHGWLSACGCKYTATGGVKHAPNLPAAVWGGALRGNPVVSLGTTLSYP